MSASNIGFAGCQADVDVSCARSNAKDHGQSTEVYRDNEAVESTRSITAITADNAEYEYGDDQGALQSLYQEQLLTHARTQAGIMSEMMDETLDMIDEDAEELDEEADKEIEKVLFEITNGKLGEAQGKVGALSVLAHHSCAGPHADSSYAGPSPRRGRRSRDYAAAARCSVTWVMLARLSSRQNTVCTVVISALAR